MGEGTYHLVTLGCPKNQVDSDKLAGTLAADGMASTDSPAEADLIVVNTCAFIADARQESVDTVLALADLRRDGARLVVTGCMAERYGDELAAVLPEVDSVAGFGVPVVLGRRPDGPSGSGPPLPSFDLLNLPRPAAARLGPALGLREDRRGLRPGVRVLCDPYLQGPTAEPLR